MSLAEDLRRRLQPFDGRAMSLLGEAEAALCGEPDYVDALLALVPDKKPFVESGATWLLKSFLEKGGALSAQQSQALIASLPEEEQGAHWSTALHLCQSMRYLELTGAQASALWVWLKPLLTHKRPFIRAWSLDALAYLARHHERHRAPFQKALNRANEDEAASVRARARGLARLA